MYSCREIFPALRFSLEEFVLMLVQQVLSCVEGLFELLEPFVHSAPVVALISCFDQQIQLWHDGGLQFTELTRHVHAKIG